jgi:hypothetical protein
MKLSRKEFYLGLFAIVLAAMSRLLPHPPNFSPVISMAVFGGFYFWPRWKAVVFPLAAMMLSDLFLGVHTLLPLVYGILALTALAPRWLKLPQTSSMLMQSSLLASVFFFVTSNLCVWAFSAMYPKTWEGLLYCFTLAIPFFHWTVLGSLFYSAIFCLVLRTRESPALGQTQTA